jgi:FSR family fosmidomycin resistance protein-like MFS transporter
VNKPVVVTEETLNAPVIAADVSASAKANAAVTGPAYLVLGSISFSHFLNDTMQSLIPSVYPILKDNYALSFAQIGMITLAFQVTASLLQPLIGHFTDRKPQPFSLAIGMGSTFVGLLMLSVAHDYTMILIAAALVGLGSAMWPVLAALIVVPFGQPSISWFSSIAFVAVVILWQIGRWYKPRIVVRDKKAPVTRPADLPSTGRTAVAIGILIMLVFSKYIYLSSLSSYYTFYLMHKFAVTTQNAQLLLFVFLGAVASGVYFGGPLGDRFGRRYVIWFSILGTLPFTLLLPYVSLGWTVALSVVIGFILASAMPAIIVYAQELMPHRFGMISGLFFGFAFGAGGLGAALLGIVADHKGIDFVYHACAFLPAIGLLAVFLPSMPRRSS